jgi:hypothetical protein
MDTLGKPTIEFTHTVCNSLISHQLVFIPNIGYTPNPEISFNLFHKNSSLFKRACNAVSDWPERVCTAWLEFEREEANSLAEWDIGTVFLMFVIP